MPAQTIAANLLSIAPIAPAPHPTRPQNRSNPTPVEQIQLANTRRFRGKRVCSSYARVDDTGLLISIAQRSNALLAAMRADLQASLDNGLLVEILPPQWPASVPVTLAWSADAPPPAAERLIQELQIVIEADRNS